MGWERWRASQSGAVRLMAAAVMSLSSAGCGTSATPGSGSASTPVVTVAPSAPSDQPVGTVSPTATPRAAPTTPTGGQTATATPLASLPPTNAANLAAHCYGSPQSVTQGGFQGGTQGGFQGGTRQTPTPIANLTRLSTTTKTVRAKVDWSDPIVFDRAGKLVIASIAGQWTVDGPSGSGPRGGSNATPLPMVGYLGYGPEVSGNRLLPTAPLGAMLVQIQRGGFRTVHQVCTSTITIDYSANNEVSFGINDNDGSCMISQTGPGMRPCHDDNEGELVVKVEYWTGLG